MPSLMRLSPHLPLRRLLGRPLRRPLYGTLCLLALLLAGGAGGADADTLVVDGVCTLGDAILAANTDAPAGNCPAGNADDILVLDVRTSLLAADLVSSSLLGGAHAGLPDVTSTITLRAGTESVVERDLPLNCTAGGADHFRLLNVVPGGKLTLDGVTLRNGCAPNGGAIYMKGVAFSAPEPGEPPIPPSTTLTILGGFVTGNTARGDGGAEATRGGALFVGADSGLLAVSDATFETNQALGASGDPAGQAARGGAIFIEANALAEQIDRSFFFSNEARGGHATTGEAGVATGGAIDSESAVGLIRESSFGANRAEGGQGGTMASADAHGGAIFAALAMTLEGTDLIGNEAKGGNSGSGVGGSASGGALHSANVMATRLTLSGNRALGGTGETGGDAEGGGVFDAVGGSYRQTTVTGNAAEGGFGNSTAGAARGGGLFNALFAELVHCTIADNLSTGGFTNLGAFGGDAAGGGWYNGQPDAVGSHLTLTGNRAVSATGAGGAGLAQGGGLAGELILLDNTILAGNTVGQGGPPLAPNDCGTNANPTSNGYNLVQAPGSCTFASIGDLTGIDPMLGPLADDGCAVPGVQGLCVLVAPLAIDSPAVDAGSCTVSGEALDARGFPRPQDLPPVANADDGCDIGAYELTNPFVFDDGFESGDTSAWTLTVP